MKKFKCKQNIKRLTLLVFFGFLSFNTFLCAQIDTDHKIYTTLDVKQEYEIVDVVFGYKTIERYMSITKEDVQSAWYDMKDSARRLDVDAVVGIKVEMAPGSIDGLLGLVTV